MTTENVDLAIRLAEILALENHIQEQKERLETLEEEFWVLNPFELDL